MNFWEKKYHKKPKRSKEMEKKKGIRKVKWTIRGDGVVGRGDRWRPKDQQFSFYRIFIFHPTVLLWYSLYRATSFCDSGLSLPPQSSPLPLTSDAQPPILLKGHQFLLLLLLLSLSLCCMWSHHCIAQMRELLSSLKGISFHYCTFPSSPQLHASSLSFPSSL